MKCCIAAAGVFSGICLPGKWIFRTVSELPWSAASRVIFFFLLSLVLSACGGGGGSIEREVSSTPTNSSSSTVATTSSSTISSSSSSLSSSFSSLSSSSSSSSSSSASSLTGERILFDDSVQNGVLSAWVDYENASAVDSYYYDGSLSSHIRWEVLDTGDITHGKVIQVTFNATDTQDANKDNGWFGVSVDNKNSSTSLAAYAQGAISFDMRIIQNGLIHDNMIAKSECNYPCTAVELALQDPPAKGEWKNYVISMQTLIDRGLDISKVNNMFVIAPNWNLQVGQYIFQLDNIKFLQSYTAEEEKVYTRPQSYKQYIPGPEYTFAVNYAGPGSVEINGGFPIDFVMTASSSFVQTFMQPFGSPYIYPKLDLTDYYYGNVLFDLRIVDYVGTSGKFIVSAVSDPSLSTSLYTAFHHISCGPCLDQEFQLPVNNLFKTLTIPEYQIDPPPENQWVSISIPVQDLVKKGLILDKVYIPLIVRYTSPAPTNFRLQIQNVRWEYTPP